MKCFQYVSLALVFIIPFCAFTNEWTKVAEEDGITIYTKQTKGAIMPFKAYGFVGASLEQVLKILRDHKKKHLWSPKLKNVKMHKALSKEEYIFSEYYKTPWPASDREFLLKGKIQKISDGSYLLSGKSIEDNSLKDNSHVQADVKTLNLILTQKAPDLTEINFEFHGDMKGWIPTWLMNLIQKKWPLRFIQGLRKRIKTVNQEVSID
ncbi:MAG: START domain-containing protein [Bacteriovoracaceae bacterium]